MRVLVFGATGSAGGSEEVRAITRRPPAVAQDKLRVFVHGDFLDYGAVSEAFTDIDACFFCLGISVTQVSGEAEYRRITHDFAVAAAQAMKVHSPRVIENPEIRRIAEARQAGESGST